MKGHAESVKPPRGRDAGIGGNTSGLNPCGFFFGLLALFRNAVHVGFLDRPLLIGILFALILDPDLPFIGIAIFFELLWLDLIPAGTYLPPQSQLAAFVCAEAAALLQVHDPERVLPLLLLALPVAWLGSRVESAHRARQNAVHDSLVNGPVPTENDGGADPQGFVLRSLGLYAVIQGCVCLIVSLCIYSLGAVVLIYWPAQCGPGWPEIWGGALLGGLLALRLKRAYWFVTSCVIVIFAVTLLGAMV